MLPVVHADTIVATVRGVRGARVRTMVRPSVTLGTHRVAGTSRTPGRSRHHPGTPFALVVDTILVNERAHGTHFDGDAFDGASGARPSWLLREPDRGGQDGRAPSGCS